jgi:hypothetical protein
MHIITKSRINYTIIILILVAVVIYLHLREFNYQGKDYNELKNFPLISQPDNVTCGPTACQMVLKYYGKEISIDDIRKQAKIDLWTQGDKKIGGALPVFIKIALNHYDVPCKLEYGNLDKLKFYIDQERPSIVLVRSDSFMMHWVVVIGYTQKEIIIAEPGNGTRCVLDNDTFKGCWTFKTDMEGIDPYVICPICKGKGYILNKIIGKCDLCVGIGKIDPMAPILRMFEIHENTMITPN